jgi:HEAT repeat protein
MPLIHPWLSHTDESVRVNAAAALAMLGSTEGQEVLLESTRSKWTLARVEAIVALGYLTTPQARLRLLEIVNDPDDPWKSRARVALAQQELTARPAHEKVKYLGILARDSNRQVVRWAVEQLSQLDSSESIEMLRDLSTKGGRTGIMAEKILKLKEAIQE